MYLKQKELDKQDGREKNGMGRKCNITWCYWDKLIIAILLVVLLLDNWTEVEGSVVDQVGCVLGEVEYHKVEIQAHHTACKTSHSRCFRIPDPVHIQPPPYLSVWTSLSGTLSLWTIIQKE
jgi:hypothetical protein